MNRNKQILRVGALSVLLAVLLRLIGSGVLGGVFEVFAQPELASFLVYSESGRKPAVPDSTTAPPEQTLSTQSPEDTQPPETTEPVTEPSEPVDLPTEQAVFTAADIQYVQMNYSCSLRPNVDALLTQALNWDLTGDEPTVLIVHTHGTEAYEQTADTQYEEYGDYRTKDDELNLISIGAELARLLEEGGLNVIHDRTAYDDNDYLDAYDNSRVGVQELLKQYPSIKMVLDLHRDAAENPDGSQWATSATVNGQDSAQLMFVVGTNAAGLSHPNWETNLSIAEKMSVLMEKIAPGITRPINLRGQRFNHDLSPGAMIVEVGSAGNTHEEAMNAVSVLAEAILELAYGSR